ncbi:MAG: serine hydrolase [Chloroflexia bacterium]|nr:serine hydrolase [Chloroflexia bacterium]
MIDRRRLATLPLLALAPAGVTHAQPADLPVESTDWPEGDLASLGFDPALGETLVAALPDFPAVTGVCVVRSGQLAFEHYRGGYDAGTLVNIRSVTKSVTSTLVGIALERGDFDDIDLTVADLIPDRIPLDADPAVADITMHSFLSMSSGLWWDTHDDWPMLLEAENWVENTLRQPIVADQGTDFIYNTGGSHLIGVMLAAVLDRPLEEYADEFLFQPLGIQRGDWMRSPQGEVNGGSGLELLPRDMAKLGRLLMDGGQWNGTRLLPDDYAAAATTEQSEGESVTGGNIGVPYGFQWWITGATGYEAFFGLGFGGQYIYVVPDLDLVVVVAAGFGEGEQPILTSHRPIPEQIVIPAIIA